MKQKKSNNIQKFKMKFKTRKNPRQSFKVEGSMVIRDNNKLYINKHEIGYFNRK